MINMLQDLQGNYYPYPFIYPQPALMAALIQSSTKMIHTAKSWHKHQKADYNPVAHPSFLEGLDTLQMLKTFKFGTWAQKMVEIGKFDKLADVIKEEMQVFESGEFSLREDFQV